MNATQFYNSITSVYLENTCVGTTMDEWEGFMKGSVRADKRQVHRILLEQDQITSMDVRLRNPYDFYRTDTHLIYVHSGIEHFYRVIQ